MKAAPYVYVALGVAGLLVGIVGVKVALNPWSKVLSSTIHAGNSDGEAPSGLPDSGKPTPFREPKAKEPYRAPTPVEPRIATMEAAPELSPAGNLPALPPISGPVIATANVKHKHRFGSCTGVLVLTGSRLRFQSDDRDDAFDVPLTDVQRSDPKDTGNLHFRVLSRNKNYNFTGASGTVDDRFAMALDRVGIAGK
jgi:hypothetical protein